MNLFSNNLQEKEKAYFQELTPENIQYLRNRYNHVNRWVIADMIRRTAYHHPHKPALISRHNAMTYLQLEKECNKLANAFIDLGVRKYQRVAILAHNTIHNVLTWFACCKVGAVYLAINYFWSGSEISYCINHSESTVFIVEDTLYEIIEDFEKEIDPVKAWIWSDQGEGRAAPDKGFLNFEDFYFNYSELEPDTILHIEDPCQMTYTSGTESRPKGVIINNQSLLSEYMGCILDGEYSSDDVNINAMPLYHSIPRNIFLNPIFYIGGTNILTDLNIEEILTNIEKYSATLFYASSKVWIDIIKYPNIEDFDLSSLQKIYYGESSMPVEAFKELLQIFPDTKIYGIYGQTELAPFHTILKPQDALKKLGSVGRGGLNMETRLEDEEGRPIEQPHIPGEICGRGPHAMLMYFKDPDKTETTMRYNWLHSGDSGAYDQDGHLNIVDRMKDIINSQGQNIASREVEETIYLDNRVKEAAAIGVPHPEWNEALVAIVVPHKKENLTEEEITNLCKYYLSFFKAPQQVIFTDYLPKTPTGKILKKDMREAYKALFTEEL